MASTSMSSASPSGLDMPINLAVDFADELEFELGLSPLPASSMQPPQPSSVHMSPAPSQNSGKLTSVAPTSPSSTAYQTSPPTSPIPTSFPPDTRPDSDSEPERSKRPSSPLPSSYKGKSRAIPTPTHVHVLRDLDAGIHEFHTPPDTSFGTPSGSGPSTSRRPLVPEPPRNLPSIMPLADSEEDSEPTPRPSRLRPRSRAVSGLSFSSIKDAVNRRRQSGSGTSSPAPGLARKLSLKGLGALVRRKTSRSRSGLSSGVTSGASTPASAFMTPSSTIVRRPANARGSSPWLGPNTPVETPGPKEEVVRPVLGRADTAPGDYFGFTFGFEDDEERVEEPSCEDSSDVLLEAKVQPASGFQTLPRELHVLVLVHLARSYVDDYEREIREGNWSAGRAGSELHKWVGEAAGLRAIVGTARVSRTWHAVAHDGSFWSKIKYASLVPPRVGIPVHTNWVPSSVRAQVKDVPSRTQLEAQDERMMRLLQAAGPCLTELDLRGFARITPRHVERLARWVSSPTTVVPKPDVPVVQSLLSLTRYDILPTLPPNTTNLTRLVLTSCMQITSPSLHTLLSASPLLTHLELRALPAVTDETCSILSTTCRALTYLDVARCPNLGPEAIAHICGVARPYIPNTGLLQLKTLHLAGYAYVDTISLKRLGKSLGHVLETLNLAGSWGVWDDSIASYVEIQPTTAQIERAKVIEVERWARARRGDVGAVQDQAEFVTLTAREAGLDPTLAGPFYRRSTALRHLNLSGCRRLTDGGLGGLAHAVPNLEILEVAGIPGIAQPGLVRLLKTTPRIRRLDLEEAGVGDAVLDVLTPPMQDEEPPEETEEEESIQIAMRADSSHPGHALTHLLLSHCASPQLTSPALAQLVRACPKLQVLVVDGTQVDDRVVRFFVCAAQARSLTGAEIAATDTRHVARSGLPPISSVRPRRGTRDWASRGMGYVDARDGATEGDECDESRVVLKSYWSWQAVDGVLDRRRAGTLNRRNTEGGMGASGIRVGPRWRPRQDDRPGCVIM